MLLGINYPWSYNHCGADLGPNPYVDLNRWRREKTLAEKGRVEEIPLPGLFDHLDRNLRNLKEMRIGVVRLWMLAHGYNFAGDGPFRRNTPSPSPGIPHNDCDFTPNPDPDPRFAFHFREFLKRCAKVEMKVIPSLISFEFTGGIHGRRDVKGLAAGGRAKCVKDPVTRVAFLQTALLPLLDASKGFENLIYAWEVINEPFWSTSAIGPLSNPHISIPSPGEARSDLGNLMRWPEVTVEQMNDFIRVTTKVIGDSGFRSTVGHRFRRDLRYYPGGNRPQFHYYAKPALSFGDPYQIKGSGLFAGNPKPFLGEFDSALNRFGRPWPELGNKDTTVNRIRLLEDEGCELALLWPDLGAPGFKDEEALVVKNDPIKLTAPTRQAVVEFTRGKLPPPTD